MCVATPRVMDDQKDESNPFSFKTFLKRGEGPPAAPAATKGKGTRKDGAKKKEQSKKDGSAFPDSEEIGGRKSDSENPFSFTKFVERKSSKKTSSSTVPLFNSSSSGEDEDSSLTVVNQAPLGPRPPSSKVTTTKPPPISRGSKTGKSPLQTKKKDAVRKPRRQKNEISIFDTSDASDTETNAVTTVGFPVPISAGVGGKNGVLRRRASSKSSSSSTSNSNSPENARRGLGLGLGGGASLGDMAMDTGFGETGEVRKLRAENERLVRELQQSQEELKKQTERNAVLKNKMKALKKKEAEDTKVLEDVVQKVESNLVATTKRAVSAEASIVKLKKEVANLQAELAKSTPQAVHQHYEEILHGVREKSTFASQQLAAASAMADRNIREMLSGVEALKNVAEMLEFVDRISEVRTSDQSRTAS